VVKKLKKRRIQGEKTSKKDDTILLKNKLTQQNSAKYAECRKTWPAE